MRNTVGRFPEQRIRRLLLQYLFENRMLLSPEYDDADSLPIAPANGEYLLVDDFVMAFSSEPDIAFRRGNSLEATIEISEDAPGLLSLARSAVSAHYWQPATSSIMRPTAYLVRRRSRTDCHACALSY